jgi:hypothetical protein
MKCMQTLCSHIYIDNFDDKSQLIPGITDPLACSHNKPHCTHLSASSSASYLNTIFISSLVSLSQLWQSSWPYHMQPKSSSSSSLSTQSLSVCHHVDCDKCRWCEVFRQAMVQTAIKLLKSIAKPLRKPPLQGVDYVLRLWHVFMFQWIPWSGFYI